MLALVVSHVDPLTRHHLVSRCEANFFDGDSTSVTRTTSNLVAGRLNGRQAWATRLDRGDQQRIVVKVTGMAKRLATKSRLAALRIVDDGVIRRGRVLREADLTGSPR